MIIMALVIAICAIVMGSGNAPFMSFASLIPNIAAGLHVPAVCNDYADAFCHDVSARCFADYCGGGRYVRNCRRFAFCGSEADSDPHGSRFRGEYDCHYHAILLSD